MKSYLVKRIETLFSWLTSPRNKGKEKRWSVEGLSDHLLSQYTPGELISSGEKALLCLEGSKKEFIEKTGCAGAAFVARYIEPELSLLKQALKSLKELKPSSSEKTMKTSIGTVELVALLRNPQRPFHKIRESTERYVRQALFDDMAFLRTYPREVFTYVAPSEDEAILRKIERELKPVEKKMSILLAKKPQGEDFYALFVWRETIDKERQELHDMVLKCVEENVSPSKLKSSVESEFLYWYNQSVQNLLFTQLVDAFQYLFELVKSSKPFRSDLRVADFFDQCKQRFHALLNGEGEYPENDRMRVLQTIRLIEEFVEDGEEMG